MADLDVHGKTVRVINVHMQTTSFDRMRSKAAKAKETHGKEGQKDIYINYTDNLESNILKRAEQAEMPSPSWWRGRNTPWCCAAT